MHDIKNQNQQLIWVYLFKPIKYKYHMKGISKIFTVFLARDIPRQGRTKILDTSFSNRGNIILPSINPHPPQLYIVHF